ncbi:hypothetical protein AC578_4528 [Pseudocercospora eumusae]|uniref:BHLH domain-containing protein n=1 Tax=Pseudocercospora eumusae TaxID=321146 RepID=A0A139HGB6_9PEZI|nr:hypothetical protein AC578_4528 [Pseudocercospora eumusae]
MAELGGTHFNQDTLFVSPDNLMIDHDLNSCFQDTRQQETLPNPYGDHSPAQQARSVSFAEQQRPNLSLPVHSLSEWQIPTQASLRTNLPPTPISPFRPLRTLTEDERRAFPCLGGPENCWNISLCPKHRQWPDTPSSSCSSRQSESSQTSGAQGQSQAERPSNSRRRSCPAESQDDDSSRIKIKRNVTDPDEVQSSQRPPLHHRSISRTSLSRGRVPHNLVERRYRDNLNHQIEALRLVLPSLKDAVPSDETSFDHPRMPSKAVVISTAATYIKDMANERQRLISANEALQDQVGSLQKLLRGNESSVVQYINAMRLTGAHHLATPP